MEVRVRVGEPAEQIAMEQMESLYSMVLVPPGLRCLAMARATKSSAASSGGPAGWTHVLRVLEQAHSPVLLRSRPGINWPGC